MTNEEIKKIVDDERVEQLTAQTCHHWNVATQRLDELTKELDAQVETCVEAEIYAVIMRMQSAVMALVELNKLPCAYLLSEYTDRIGQTIAKSSIRRSTMTLFNQLQNEQLTKKQGDFIDFVTQSLAQHFALPQEEQKAIEQKVSPMQHIMATFAQYMNPNDLVMILQVFQNMNANDDSSQEETTDYMQRICKMTDELRTKMDENLSMMVVWLMLLMLMPDLIINLMKKSRSNHKSMAALFNKVLVRVRKSDNWYDYWKNRRDTLRVVSDSCSWNDIMTAERAKVLAELGKVPGALFAKWSTDREAFEADFFDAHLDDDALRHFIFHLTYLYEIARELDPTTKFGDEDIVNTEVQQVGDAVMAAARKLINLVDDSWMPHYETMWKELIENEIIFSHLKVTRKSPHNNLFTARFFCHLVGEMKKSAVFGAHSDNDLAEKLTDKRSAGTFRKNIQEGLCDDEGELKILFHDIFLKYKDLAHPKR
jgi:hypothetical protein